MLYCSRKTAFVHPRPFQVSRLPARRLLLKTKLHPLSADVGWYNRVSLQASFPRRAIMPSLLVADVAPSILSVERGNGFLLRIVIAQKPLHHASTSPLPCPLPCHPPSEVHTENNKRNVNDCPRAAHSHCSLGNLPASSTRPQGGTALRSKSVLPSRERSLRFWTPTPPTS